MKKSLDFVVIGASKSGTTSLYEWLNCQPEIFIPSGKEVPFFSDDPVYKKGIEHYFRAYFARASSHQLWGTITPQYLCGQGQVSPQQVAQRLYASSPTIKIICVLRDPVQRAFSHYKMYRKLGYEQGSFLEALARNSQTKQPSFEDNFLYSSMYGQLLSHYYHLFPSQNIKVIMFDDLVNNTETTLQDIVTFLKVDKLTLLNNIDNIHRKGGDSPKIKLLTPGFLYRIPWVRWLWKNVVPHGVRRFIEYRINLWNVKPDNTTIIKNDTSYLAAIKYFKDDILVTANITRASLPWLTTTK